MFGSGMGPKRNTEYDDRIVAYLLQGMAPNHVAKLIGKDRGFVIRVAKHHKGELGSGILQYLEDEDSMDEISAGLNTWKQYLVSESRQELLGKTMAKMGEMIESCQDTKSLRDLCVCVGILVDKFGVEQGYTDNSAKSALLKLFETMEEGEIKTEDILGEQDGASKHERSECL
jgi:hypothetical protein